MRLLRTPDLREPDHAASGPADPLANDETFDELSQVHREYPDLMKCVSTNGLLLKEKLPRFLDAGICALTVTVNAPDAEVGQHVYMHVCHNGAVYRGRDAAEILITRQFLGIRAALDAGLAVKVNTVLIPGVNDRHVVVLARRLRDAGVPLMNLMPLIPAGKMLDRRASTCDELRQIRDDCERILPQFRKCEQCRADIVRFPQKAAAEA